MRKNNIMNFILVIVDKLIKIIYYMLIYITINMINLVKIIINIIIKYYGL